MLGTNFADEPTNGKARSSAMPYMTFSLTDPFSQLEEIAQAVGAPGAKQGKEPKTTRRNAGSEYKPAKGSYGAHILEVLEDGNDQHRDDIGEAVKAKVGKDYNEGTLGQAMTKL